MGPWAEGLMGCSQYTFGTHKVFMIHPWAPWGAHDTPLGPQGCSEDLLEAPRVRARHRADELISERESLARLFPGPPRASVPPEFFHIHTLIHVCSYYFKQIKLPMLLQNSYWKIGKVMSACQSLQAGYVYVCPWTHGRSDPWALGHMGPWAHGPMGPPGPPGENQKHRVMFFWCFSLFIIVFVVVCYIYICTKYIYYIYHPTHGRVALLLPDSVRDAARQSSRSSESP